MDVEGEYDGIVVGKADGIDVGNRVRNIVGTDVGKFDGNVEGI